MEQDDRSVNWYKKEDYNHRKKYHLQAELLEVEESEMIEFLGRFSCKDELVISGAEK